MDIKTSAYLVIIPQHSYAGKLDGISIDRVVRTLPKLNSRSVAVKLNVTMDSKFFEQVLPEVTIRLNDERQLFVPDIDVESPPELEALHEAAG